MGEQRETGLAGQRPLAYRKEGTNIKSKGDEPLRQGRTILNVMPDVAVLHAS